MPTQLLPLDPAEAIWAPFHDPAMAPDIPFRFTPLAAAACGSDPRHWCYTVLWWHGAPADLPAARLEVACDVPAGRHDRLLFCLNATRSVRLSVAVRADGAWHDLGRHAGTGTRMDLELPRPPGRLDAVRIDFGATTAGAHRVELSWFGLADTALRARLEAAEPAWDPAWPGLIAAERPAQPRFARGLLFAAADLPALRAKAQRSGWRAWTDRLVADARRACTRAPEDEIGGFVPWDEMRYRRARQGARTPLSAEGVAIGFAGLLTGDRELQDHALRRLLALVHMRSWVVSAECAMRGSDWGQRCFAEELTSTAVALLADWYDWALTPRARELVRSVLWDNGLAAIERDVMKWEYLQHMNQGPWFCRARVLGGLLLESGWPRTGGYADRAHADLLAMCDRYLLPDGGVDEGPGYLAITLQAVLPACLAWSRARGRPLAEALPPRLARVRDYVAALSAGVPGEVITEGDCHSPFLKGDLVAFMAAHQPESPWGGMLATTLARQVEPGNYYDSYVVGALPLVHGPEEVPAPACVVPTFARLPHTGHLTSRRTDGGRALRLHLVGCKAGASHTHLDKGALLCEVDDRPALIDRGVIAYADARCGLLKGTARHNCLTPVTADGAFPDQAPATVAVVPEGEGDAHRLCAEVDLANVWRDRMRRCRRGIASDDLLTVRIVDEGELLDEGRVAFHLHALTPWTIAAGVATTDLGGVLLRVEVPWAATLAAAEDLVDHAGRPVHHLVATSGVVRTFALATLVRIVR